MGAGRSLARWTSILLHPFVAMAVLALAATWRLEPAGLPRTLLGLAVALGVVGGFVWQRRRSGAWETVDASRRRERPALYALALAVALSYWGWLGGALSRSGDGVLAVVAMLCVAGIANCWIKLSLHMASLAFAALVLLHLWPPLGIVGLACLPLLGWSRLALARHGLREVLGGTALGLLAAGVLLLRG